MKQTVEILQTKYNIELNSSGMKGQALVDGQPVEFDLHPGSAGSPASLLIDGHCYSVSTYIDEEGVAVRVNERDVRALVTDVARDRKLMLSQSRASSAKPSGLVKAPMPGLIVKIEVEEGMSVEKGAGLVIVEAMKMENEIKAAFAGVVSGIKISKGDTVEKGQPLMTIVAPPSN